MLHIFMRKLNNKIYIEKHFQGQNSFSKDILSNPHRFKQLRGIPLWHLQWRIPSIQANTSLEIVSLSLYVTITLANLKMTKPSKADIVKVRYLMPLNLLGQ